MYDDDFLNRGEEHVALRLVNLNNFYFRSNFAILRLLPANGTDPKFLWYLDTVDF